MDAKRKRAANLALIGPMGAGKSMLAHHLAIHFGLTCLDADARIEDEAGASVADIFAREGEAGFRQRERDMLATLARGSGQVIATGGGAVLDPQTRAALAARCVVLWLKADVATQLARLAGDTARPLLKSADPAATLQALSSQREPLYRDVADIELDTSGLDVAEVTRRATAAVEACWQREANAA